MSFFACTQIKKELKSPKTIEAVINVPKSLDGRAGVVVGKIGKKFIIRLISPR